MKAHSVILFDGVCNLCNTVVQVVIKRDRKNIFRFAPLQSEQANQLLNGNLKPTMNSFILLDDNVLYTKSTAALRVCRRLGGLWRLMYGFIIVPKAVRDAVYDWIAANRYRWFGRKTECMVSTPDLRSKFIH